jgi:3-hydroxy-9,10-secoandrosta-1,3,5(10)-triene-9,17-dione monooxygenase
MSALTAQISSSGTRPTAFAAGSEEDLVQAARNLAPLLRENAPRAESQRSPTDEVVAALDQYGMWAVVTPQRWGGLGLPSIALHRINREVAKGDPAAAWVLQIINGCTWIASLTSDRLQEEIFSGAKPPRVCSSFAAACRADVVDGGYVVNGTWPYNSGSRQSSWGQYLVNIHHPDGSVKPGNFAYIPMTNIEVGNDWQTAGMQGTSSDSSTARDVFVPQHRMVLVERSFGYREPGKRHVGEPSDNWQNIPLIRATCTGLLVGIVENALETVISSSVARPLPTTIYAAKRDSSVVQRDLGEIGAQIAAAHDLAEGLCLTLDEGALRGRIFTPLERAHQKARTGLVVNMLTASMDKLMSIAGSGAFNQSSWLQRCWRDLGVASRHLIFNPEIGFEVLGRAQLGIEPNIIPPPLV